MRYLHTMVRVTDIYASLRFWCDLLGLQARRVLDALGEQTREVGLGDRHLRVGETRRDPRGVDDSLGDRVDLIGREIDGTDLVDDERADVDVLGPQVVDGLEISDATRAGIDHNIKALQEEYDAVKALGFIK